MLVLASLSSLSCSFCYLFVRPLVVLFRHLFPRGGFDPSRDGFAHLSCWFWAGPVVVFGPSQSLPWWFWASPVVVLGPPSPSRDGFGPTLRVGFGTCWALRVVRVACSIFLVVICCTYCCCGLVLVYGPSSAGYVAELILSVSHSLERLSSRYQLDPGTQAVSWSSWPSLPASSSGLRLA